MVTMRGAERPGRVLWTRPFLPPLRPLTDCAARQTFIDISDDMGDTDIGELLDLTDNLPLAVNLVANIASFEGYAAVLSRWKEEKTSLLSDGPDKRSNLDTSIMLSISSPRMHASPGSQQLLGLLSLLPDGISDNELLQSNLPISGIARCKSTLIRTSLAYLERDGRIKVLVPIREYVRQFHPPSPEMIRPLRHHFHNLIILWEEYRHRSSSSVVPRIASNVGNIHALLSHGLKTDTFDLKDTIKNIINLDSFCRISGRGPTGLTEYLPEYLERLGDNRLYGAYLADHFLSWQYHPISDPEGLAHKAVQFFKNSNDRSGEARLYSALGAYYRGHDNDTTKAVELFSLALSLAEEIGDPARQCLALGSLSQCNWQLGNYVEGQKHAREMRRIAKLNGYILSVAHAIQSELLCRTSRGDFTHSFELSAEARKLLAFCGLEGSAVDLILIDSDADIHFQKTEYTESRNLYIRTFHKHPPLAQAYDRLAIVNIDIEIGADEGEIQRDLDAVHSSFVSIQNPPGITLCEVAQATLDLREGRRKQAKSTLERCFTSTRGNDQEISILCLEKLADITHGMFDVESTLFWAFVLLAFARKGQNNVSIHHALRYLGDIFQAQNDETTALSLFEVAQEGYRAMGIHRSLGDCMLRIGDILYHRSEIGKAVEMWKAALPLFQRSLQRKDVERTEDRLTWP
ncbi:hypothetical protein B0H10DRAFT_316633 [Mycena sp. CBHHK59/15]|nr:hypothetical protein B0H10DRAFT_316633 [Mycena sp. CBHHK59/15]